MHANKSKLHTSLTSFRAIRLFRKAKGCFINLYIKDVPMGRVHRLVVDATDTVFNLWNIFDAHSGSNNGIPSSRMLVLPVGNAIFELNNELASGTDLNLARTSGLDRLSRYGLNKAGSTVVLLSFALYSPTTAPMLIKQLLSQNSATDAGDDIFVSSNLESIPHDISVDSLQAALLTIAHMQYARQLSSRDV